MRMRLAAAGLVLCAGLVLTAAPAWAVDPVDANGSSVVDEAGVLTADEEQTASAAIASLRAASGAEVTAVLVPTFTGPTDGKAWARATGQASGLGKNDLVLAIATGSRQVYWLPNSEFPVGEQAIDAVGNDDLKPRLKAGQWAAGIVAFANGLQTAAQAKPASGTAGSTSAASGVVTAVLVLLAIAVAVILVVVLVRRRRRRAGAALPSPFGSAAPPVPQVDQAALDRQAASGLVRLDDALRTSEQELGFATAEFGDAATAQFTAVLASAKSDARTAFGIRQQLDDDRPETPDERRSMTTRIIALVDGAQQRLDAETAGFDTLRDLERHLPDAVRAGLAEQTRLSAVAATAATTLQRLAATHGEATVHGAMDDLGQAQDLLGFAARGLQVAGAQPTGAQPAAAQPDGGTGQAAVAVRGAQQALGQAAVLLDGVAGTPDELLDAARRLDATASDARRDLAEARALAPGAGADRAALESAARDLDVALKRTADDAPSVVLKAVLQADTALDAVLGRVRDRDAQARHARSALPGAVLAAERAIDEAGRFIDSRRGGVGADARTRLAEAQRLLDAASAAQSSDPVGALASAQRAQLLAGQASDGARQDVDDFTGGGYRGGRGFGGGYGGGYGTGTGIGGVVAGAALGGILGGILNGGNGGGWGGGGYGGGWGGNVGGGFDGGDQGGGFGDGGGSWGDGGGGGFDGGGDSGGGGSF